MGSLSFPGLTEETVQSLRASGVTDEQIGAISIRVRRESAPVIAPVQRRPSPLRQPGQEAPPFQQGNVAVSGATPEIATDVNAAFGVPVAATRAPLDRETGLETVLAPIVDIALGAAAGAEILARRTAGNLAAQGRFLVGQGDTPQQGMRRQRKMLRTLPDRLQSDRPLLGNLARGFTSLGMSERPMSIGEMSILDAIMLGGPPASAGISPIAAGLTPIRNVLRGALGRPAPLIPQPAAPVTRDVLDVLARERPVPLTQAQIAQNQLRASQIAQNQRLGSFAPTPAQQAGEIRALENLRGFELTEAQRRGRQLAEGPLGFRDVPQVAVTPLQVPPEGFRGIPFENFRAGDPTSLFPTRGLRALPPEAGLARDAIIRRNQVLDQSAALRRGTAIDARTGLPRNVVRDVQAQVRGARRAGEDVSESVLPARQPAPTSVAGTVPPHAVARAAVAGANPNNDPLIKRVTEAINATEKATTNREAAVSQMRTRQIARVQAQRSRSGNTWQEQLAANRRGLSTGGAVTPERTPIAQLFTQDEVDSLFNRISAANSPLVRGGDSPGYKNFTMLNAEEAFGDLFHPSTTVIPTRGGINLLSKVYGEDFARAIMKHRSYGQKSWDNFLDAWNLPRALLSTFDISATLRQGGLLAPNNKKIFGQAFQNQIKAFGSEDFARANQTARRLDPDFARFTDAGSLDPMSGRQRLFLSDISEFANLESREEIFLSRFAGRLPLVRNSERAYTEMLNDLRFKTMKKYVKDIEKTGRAITEEELDAIATFINTATGRGPLGPLAHVAPILNGLLFSPRLLTSRFSAVSQGLQAVAGEGLALAGKANKSRFALPATTLARSPTIRRKMMGDLLAFAGTGFLTLKLLDASGMANVTADPRSSDFGKATIGDTRVDLFGGFLPIVRLAAQMAPLSGQRVSAGTGTVSDIDRSDAILRFFRSKAHPSLGLVIDVASEEDFLGESFTLTPGSFVPKATIEGVREGGIAGGIQGLGRDIRKNPILKTLTPLVIQDIAEGLAVGGARGAVISGVGGALGAGVVSFDSPESAAREMYPGVEFTELEPYEQGRARELHRETSDREPSEFDKINVDHLRDLNLLANNREMGSRDKVTQYFSINAFYSGKRRGTAQQIFGESDFQTQQGGTPAEQAALQEYFDAQKQATLAPGSAAFNSDLWNQLISQLEVKWLREGTFDYVARNTHTSPVPEKLLQVLPRSTFQRIKRSSDARAAHDRTRDRRTQ